MLVTVTCSSKRPVWGLNTLLPARIPNCAGAVVTVVYTREAAAEPSLFDGSGSDVLDEAEAMLVNEPFVTLWSVTVKFVTPPPPREESAGQVTALLENTPPAD